MSDTPRTDAYCNHVCKYYKDDWNRWQLTANFAAQLERELAAANKRLEALAFDAARVEWKYGRNDDGTPKNWTEWNNLRESLGEHVRQPQELVEANGKIAAIPRNGSEFGSLLARYGIVHSDAIDDPEGYDGYATLDAICSAFEELSGSPR